MVKIRRKRRRVKGIVITFSFFFITGLSLGLFYNKIFADHLNIRELDVNSYIEIADQVSAGKAQLNWQYLAAIDGVRFDNEFKDINSQATEELARAFIVEKSTSSLHNKKYGLRNLPEVLDILSLEKKEQKRVYGYLADLQGVGFNKNRVVAASAKSKFIGELTEEAKKLYYMYGIFPSISIAQAILESGWGESQLTVKGNNLFGIKADRSWSGERIALPTQEFFDCNKTAEFRVYNNKDEALQDYAQFLRENPRYKKQGFFAASYYIEQAKALEEAGYSTKRNQAGEKIYADLLVQVIRQYNLQLLDYEVQVEKVSLQENLPRTERLV